MRHRTAALVFVAALLCMWRTGAMNMNVAGTWGDKCSPPEKPELAFYSPQSQTMLFDGGGEIEIICQSGLRSVGLSWSLHRNRLEKPFRQGEAEALPPNRFRIRVATAGLHPGFYDLHVKLNAGMQTVDGVCTFGWRSADMPIRETRPADFAAFWEKAKRSLDGIALDPQEAPMQEFGPAEIGEYNSKQACLPPDYDPAGHVVEKVESCKVSFAGPDGGRVYGWLAKPPGRGPFPVMLVLPGAGFARRTRPLEHARHGYLALDIQIHGQDVDLDTYEKLPGYYSGYVFDPVDKYYYYNVHLRCLMALRYLASRPDADVSRIALAGGSQGGRLAIVVAALDPRVKAVVSCIANSPNYPELLWISRCNGYTTPRDDPKDPRFKNRVLADGMDLAGAPPMPDDDGGACFAYYDPMNYAPDVRCPVLMNAGLIDPVSPPYSVWAVYARLGTKDKTLVPLPGLGHDWSAEFDRRAWRWLDLKLGLPPKPDAGGTLFPAGTTVAATAAPAAGLRIVCLGDSITGRSDLSKYLKFSHILELMVRSRLPGRDVAVLNRGIGGDSTEGVLKRLDADALAPKPDIVVLLIGGNDAASKRADAREKTRRNYDEILTRLQTAGIRVLAITYAVLPNPEHPETAWVHLDDNNDLIAEVAAKHGVPVLDMAAPMQAAAKGRPVGELVSEKDGVHLNPGGELVFAESIFDKLVGLGWLPATPPAPPAPERP